MIDCRNCRLAPVPGSDECIRCMVEAMSSAGGAERIVLRTGREVPQLPRVGTLRDGGRVGRVPPLGRLRGQEGPQGRTAGEGRVPRLRDAHVEEP